MATPLTLAVIGEHPTIQLAAAELQRCLSRATGREVVTRTRSSFDTAAAALWVGPSIAFEHIALPLVGDPRLDDAIGVQAMAGRGVITGNNPRAVLLAAYRYLHELGCRWVRPGADGEHIPVIDIDASAVDVVEAPSYRHRGVCIEGAVSLDHVRNVIEWLPRVGMNSYFIQFREGYTFFDRWYSHTGNPFVAPEPFDVAKARELIHDVSAEITRRGLLFHAVGHGWTCEPFGIPGLGWEYPPEPVPPEAVQYLALVNGKRELWGGVALNTNLCYSNPDVRRIMVDDITRYASAHPEVDLLHLWLADGTNNHCECEACRKMRPADYYVMLLNEVDRRLTELNLPTRIVFLIYVDLLWPPEQMRLAHPDRFALMFAPITRTYSRPYAVRGALPPLPPFERNHLSFPRGVEENVAFLRAWQALFDRPLDGFDFDYHLMWDHLCDPGHMQASRVLHADLQQLRALDLDGFNSCQVQRASFPTGLPMTLLGWTLWDRERDFDELARDYFDAAFGPDGALAQDYLARLSALFDPPYLRGEQPAVSAAAAERLRQVPAAVEAFGPVITRNAGGANPCHAASWRYLAHHADLTIGLAGALEARARGDAAGAREQWEVVRRMAWQREPELHAVFDTWLFDNVFSRKFKESAS